MSKIAQASENKTDYSFIASLIIIVVVALYFGVDIFQRSNLSGYLEKTGNELFAKIIDQQDRLELEKSYAELLDKIDKKEISPEKAEELASNLINLKLAKEHLNEEELKVFLQTTLNNATDSLEIMVESGNNDRWLVLNEKVNNIERFEKGLLEVQLADRGLNSSGTFEYAVDDSLHILADDSYKGDLFMAHSSDYADEIIVLEKERNLKWSRDLKEHLTKEREVIRKNIALFKAMESRINISTSISSDAAQTVLITTNDSDKVIEFKFNFNTPFEASDSVLNIRIPEIPEIPDLRVD